jgi:hypothetical protein
MQRQERSGSGKGLADKAETILKRPVDLLLKTLAMSAYHLSPVLAAHIKGRELDPAKKLTNAVLTAAKRFPHMEDVEEVHKHVLAAITARVAKDAKGEENAVKALTESRAGMATRFGHTDKFNLVLQWIALGISIVKAIEDGDADKSAAVYAVDLWSIERNIVVVSLGTSEALAKWQGRLAYDAQWGRQAVTKRVTLGTSLGVASAVLSIAGGALDAYEGIELHDENKEANGVVSALAGAFELAGVICEASACTGPGFALGVIAAAIAVAGGIVADAFWPEKEFPGINAVAIGLLRSLRDAKGSGPYLAILLAEGQSGAVLTKFCGDLDPRGKWGGEASQRQPDPWLRYIDDAELHLAGSGLALDLELKLRDPDPHTAARTPKTVKTAN